MAELSDDQRVQKALEKYNTRSEDEQEDIRDACGVLESKDNIDAMLADTPTPPTKPKEEIWRKKFCDIIK